MTTARSSLLRNTVRTSLLAAVLVSPTVFAGVTDVPFKAAFTISEVVAFGGGPGCSGNATGTISGSGNATHLGKATLRPLDCITVTSLPPNLQSTFSSDNLVLQAANGDFLYVTYSGTAMQQDGAYVVLNGKFTFNRGTGRFANASGGGELQGLEDISGGPFQPAVGTVMLSGKISY